MRVTILPVLVLLLAATSATAQDIREAPRPGTHLKVYDVRDLLALPGGDEEEAGASLIEMLRTFLPEGATPAGGAIRFVRGGSIAAVLEDDRHQWLQDVLEWQRRAARQRVEVTVRVLTTTPAKAKELGLGTQPVLLTGADEGTAFLRRAQKDAGAGLVTLGPVPCHPLQKKEVAAVRQVSYVSGYQVHHRVEPRAATLLDPVVDVVQDGTRVELRPLVMGDGRIGLWLELTRMDLEEPIPSRQIEIGPTRTKVEIAEPRVTSFSVESALTARTAGTVVLPLPQRDGVQLVLLLDAVLVGGDR